VPLSTAALEPLLRLTLAPGIGPQRLSRLVRHFGSPVRALAASQRELELLPGMNSSLARMVREHAGAAGDRSVRRALEAMRRAGAVAITPDDLAFPDAFRVLAEPPFVLYATGRLELLDLSCVALVGTRSPTGDGVAAAATLSRGLVAAGYGIVSGVARGIDTVAHSAALDAGGATIGVLGHGIDLVYPPENRALFTRIREAGLLLTEMPPGEGPKAGNFPRRNRLIAALSEAVVVVEMGLKSGAQHTVTFALEQGKEVMAVPGPMGREQSAGTNQLIKDGARMVTSVEDILEELRGVRPLLPSPPPRAAPPELPLLTPDQRDLLGHLSGQPRHVDELGEEVGLRPGAILAILLELELAGAVEALPGQRYRRP
jgi:DNA processing protein